MLKKLVKIFEAWGVKINRLSAIFFQRSKGRLSFVLMLHGSQVFGTELVGLYPTASLASLDQICIGNRMDESAIWEKIAWQQENRPRRSRVLFKLL